MSATDMAALEQTSLARLELDARPLEGKLEEGFIARLRARDIDAFEELVSHYERSVHSLCFRLLGNAEDARDAAQETFLKIYRGLSSFRGESGLKTWIYRIAVNQAMNQRRWWRRRHRDETVSLELSRSSESVLTVCGMLESPAASPEDEAIEREREAAVLTALGAIKKEYQVALVLREIEELSYEEIAETLGISIGTVKSRIARGREELRRRVKDII
jgi:RNA polymerase sigma-70 factor (ECF subfamily)